MNFHEYKPNKFLPVPNGAKVDVDTDKITVCGNLPDVVNQYGSKMVNRWFRVKFKLTKDDDLGYMCSVSFKGNHVDNTGKYWPHNYGGARKVETTFYRIMTDTL